MADVHTINIAELVAEKIRVRYAEISEQTFGSSNVVVDAYYPTYVRRSLVNSNTSIPELGKRCSCISPFIAQELGLYQIPIEDLTKMLGYKKQDIKTLLDTVKTKKIDIALLGLGGTGMNFFHWAEELCHFVNTVNIFKSVVVFDYDKVDLTNLFRFPRVINPLSSYQSTDLGMYKIQMIPNKTVLADRLDKSTSRITAGSLGRVQTKTYDDGKATLLPEPIYTLNSNYTNTVFYGAPDIATREMILNYKNLKFVSATHGNDDCQLYIRPEQDGSIQIESYGMINLSVFFMNQLKMTIGFLELLASDTDLAHTQPIMEYSFAKEYANGRIIKAGLNRTYNFPINTSNFLDQEVAPQETSTILAEPQSAEDVTTIEIPVNGIETAEPFNADELLTITSIDAPTVEPIAVTPVPVRARARRTTRATISAEANPTSEVSEPAPTVPLPF